jgi:hypothetical protein
MDTSESNLSRVDGSAKEIMETSPYLGFRHFLQNKHQRVILASFLISFLIHSLSVISQFIPAQATAHGFEESKPEPQAMAGRPCGSSLAQLLRTSKLAELRTWKSRSQVATCSTL